MSSSTTQAGTQPPINRQRTGKETRGGERRERKEKKGKGREGEGRGGEGSVNRSVYYSLLGSSCPSPPERLLMQLFTSY